MGSPTVLVVDDFQQNLDLLTQLLEREYCVLSASSGEDCLAMLEEHVVHVIFMDIKMPNLNGYETAEIIVKNPSTCKIPIVFLTAQPKDEDVGQSFFAGGRAYLEKPVDPENVNSVLLELLNNGDTIYYDPQ
jgi:CheY-like chemotaxis protein